MTDEGKGTLPDYTRMIRASRWLIVALTVLCAAGAAGFSLVQTERFRASATLSFQTGTESAAVAGITIPQTQTADQRAAQGADTLLNDDVLGTVRERLSTDRSVDNLRGLLTTEVDSSSNLVTVVATTTDREFTSALANTVADVSAQMQVEAERDRYAQTADDVERELRDVQRTTRRSQRQTVALTYFQRIAALRTLSLNARPVEVTSRATVPEQPFSPKPVRNTVGGLAVGLLLGIVLAFLRSTLDRRLRDTSDVEQELDLPIMGVVRREALGRSAYVSNGRGRMEEQDVESFRILRTNLEFLRLDHPPKITLVTSPLPGEGKTTVASSLALATAAAGKRTLLVECDLRRPCLAERLSIDSKPGLGDYLSGQAAPPEVLQAVRLSSDGQSADGLLAAIVAGEQRRWPGELLGSSRFGDFIAEAAQAYDTIVIDTPPLLSVADTLEMLPHVDGVLICVRADQTTRDQAVAAKTALGHLPDRPTGVVVTGVRPSRDTYDYYANTYIDDD